MKRLNDGFVNIVNNTCKPKNKRVLEVGCGNGSRSVALAAICLELMAVDPNQDAIATAKQQYKAENLTYGISNAEKLVFADNSFDLVIFSLSFHHVPIDRMNKAIHEAARVCKAEGNVIFLEPTFTGSFFDAELLFNASDGDERKEKAIAYYKMLNTHILKEISEVFDAVTFVFDSKDDFKEAMEPNKNIDRIDAFLKQNNYKIYAERRINIFKLA